MPQTAPYIFHGHDVSYFSGKVRPAFPQKSLWVREIMPDIREIVRQTGLNFFPAVQTPDGDWWQDSSDILDRLEAAHPEPPLYPTTPVQRIVAYLVELYGDETGLLPGMHYRWSFEESIEKVGVDFSTPTRNPDGGVNFARKMAASREGLGVTEASVPAIEAHTRDLLEALCAHFEAHRYLLGDSMSLADCGLMAPLYGHLYRDAVPRKLLYETAFQVCSWIERMNRPPLDQTGWLADDALPETLLPVLRVMADGVPMLLSSVAAIDEWAGTEASASEPPPRTIGMHQAAFRGVEVATGARPYTLWMLQRPLDAFRALPRPDQDTVRAALDGTGWNALLELEPLHRLEKDGFALAWEGPPA